MRIEITGFSCCGKTTLGRKLSREYGVTHYQKDNFIWIRRSGGDIMRPADERDAMYSQVISEPHWIVEGVFRESLNESFPICDCVIVLEQRFIVRFQRLIRRWIKRRRGLEPYDAAPTMGYLLYCMRWMLAEELGKKHLYSSLAPYSGKTAFFTDVDEAFRFITEKYDPIK